MTVRKTVGTVGTLAQGAVSTAASVVRHPLGTAALAAGFAKGITEAGLDLVRSTVTGPVSGRVSGPVTTPPSHTEPEDAPAETLADTAPSPAAHSAEPAEATEAPGKPAERDLPGPDLVATELPSAEDLPEPIVIEADQPVAGEAFHHEPHAASRDSDHGGHVYDREDAEGYADEIPDPVADELVFSSEAAELDPGADPAFEDEPALDLAAAKAVRREADVLQKAADPHKD